MFKDYSRRLQNITWIIYIVGILILFLAFVSDFEGPLDVVIMSQFLFALLAAVVVGDVTIRGKENLFIYRKSPNGEHRFVKARLLQSCIVVIPIVALATSIPLSFIPDTNLIIIIAYTGYTSLNAAAYTSFALGLFLLKPAFSEKTGEFMANIMIVNMVAVFLFIFLMIIFGTPLSLFLFSGIIWLIGINMLYFGKHNLSRIE
jgi:hypothetical protein